MINLFSFNGTTEKSNAEKFVIRKTSDETAAKQNEQADQLFKANKYAQAPLWLTITMYVTFAFALIVAASFIEALADVGIDTALHNSRILLPVAGACLVVAAAIFVFKKIRYNKTVASPAFQELTTNSDTLNKRSYEELSVPQSADEINVFAEVYKINKSGKRKNALGASYTVFDLKVFTENDCLCFADLYCVTAIPLSQFTAIYTVNKRASFLFWSKDEKPNSPRYKSYKIRRNNLFYYVKPCYSLRFTISGEEYEIIIPPYELEIIQKYLHAPLI